MKKSDKKLEMRQQARRKVKPGYNPGTSRDYRENVEKGRKELLIVSNQGGDSKGKKAKNELNYLLNNYLPAYDMRIEQLIDEWRTSGDPSYDPGIRGKLRQARSRHAKGNNPI
jgi:hypothetical protein